MFYFEVDGLTKLKYLYIHFPLLWILSVGLKEHEVELIVFTGYKRFPSFEN